MPAAETVRRDRWTTWGLLTPALVLLLLWLVIPAVQTLWLAVAPGGNFAGWEHLRWLVSGAGGRTALRNTVVWAVAVPLLSVAAALGLALVADRFRSRGLLETVVVVPAIISLVVVAVQWRLLLVFRPAGTDQVGVANQVMVSAGLDPVAWLVQAPVNTLLLAGGLVWATTGICLLLLSTAAQRVPDDVRDAARVDGADETQVFVRVTVPSIKGSIVAAAAATAIISIRVFDLVQVATGGAHGTEVASTAMVDTAFVANDPGRGAMLAVALGLLTVPFAAVLMRRLARAEASR